MNQSGCAIANILIIIIIITNPASLVSKFPKGFLIKPPMININPADNSDKETKDANAGDKLKYSINPWSW